MTEQCKVVGSGIEPCDVLKHITTNRIAGFKFDTMRNFNTNQLRIAVTIEKSSKNRLQISYCPACGANIETSYLEVSTND